MQNGGGEVFRCHGIVFHVCPLSVAGTIDSSASYAAASQQVGIAVSPVIAAFGRVDFRSAAKLTGHGHQRFIQQAALVQIFQKSRE